MQDKALFIVILVAIWCSFTEEEPPIFLSIIVWGVILLKMLLLSY